MSQYETTDEELERLRTVLKYDQQLASSRFQQIEQQKCIIGALIRRIEEAGRIAFITDLEMHACPPKVRTSYDGERKRTLLHVEDV